MSRRPQAVATPMAARNAAEILAASGGIEQLFRLQQTVPGGAQPVATSADGAAFGDET